jgi:hypothetical protein
MASGHVNRTKRPNTWLHRPMLQREKALANSEPSTHGIYRTWRSGLRTSGYWSKADMGPWDRKWPGADGLSTFLRVARTPIEPIAQAANPKMKPMDSPTIGTAVSVPGLKSPIEKKNPTTQEIQRINATQATIRNILFAAPRASDLLCLGSRYHNKNAITTNTASNIISNLPCL